jgi:hypothetical protein
MEQFNHISLGDVRPRAISDTFAPSWWCGRKSKTIERLHIMKKHALIVTLIAAALVGGASADTASPAASPGPRCKVSGWNPELYSFYGAKDTIVEKLAGIPANLSERRVFVQVTQGDSRADVKLYEQQEDGTFTVTEWTTKPTSRLLADIDKAIVANKGVNCVGEQVKGILGKELKEGKVSKAVAVPASPKAAFADSVKQASGEFIKSTVIILC